MRKSQFKKAICATALVSFMAFPSEAFAKAVTTTVEMKPFRGPPAYVAVYLTDPNGKYHSTIAVLGHKQKYRRHLRGWFRGVASKGGKVDGVSGASVGAGRTFKVKSNISDALLKAGYQIKVDSAVENVAEYRGEASIVLDAGKANSSADGKGFVKSITVTQ